MDQFSKHDYRFMARALGLAKKGLYTTQPNPRVGCVIVRDGEIIGEGYHQQAGQAHAEIHALKAAGAQAEGASAYVTLEPCCHYGRTSPCSLALLEAGIKRVVAAMPDPNPQVAGKGLQQLADAGVDTHVGLLQAEAETLNIGFIKRMQKGLPWVRVKLAMSLDGRTAMASGESQWITGTAARQDVQRLRARSSAILTGIGTVLADNPSMNVRASNTALGIDKAADIYQPIRVVVDTQLRMPTSAKMLSLAGETWIYTHSDDKQKTAALETAGARVFSLTATNSADTDAQMALDLHHVCQDLAKAGMNEVHVEAGAVLSGALLEAGLVDEWVIYMASHIMGDSARGLVHLPHLQQMQDRIALKFQDVRKIGDDLRLSFRPE